MCHHYYCYYYRYHYYCYYYRYHYYCYYYRYHYYCYYYCHHYHHCYDICNHTMIIMTMKYQLNNCANILLIIFMSDFNLNWSQFLLKYLIK